MSNPGAGDAPQPELASTVLDSSAVLGAQSGLTSEAPAAAATPAARGAHELASGIRALHELHLQGSLTEAEFAQAKQQVLETATAIGTRSATTAAHSSAHSRSHGKRRQMRRWRLRSMDRMTATTSTTLAGRRRKFRVASAKGSGGGGARRSASTDSTSSSSSSSSSSSRFMVVPRAKVWRTLQVNTADNPYDGELGPRHASVSLPVLHSPLFAGGGSTPGDEPFFGGSGSRPSRPVSFSAAAAAGAEDGETTSLLVNDRAATAESAPSGDGTSHHHHHNHHQNKYQASAGSPSSGSGGNKDKEKERERFRYGTFFQSPTGTGGSGAAGGTGGPLSGGPHEYGIRLEPEAEVHVRYFNSRGRSSTRFSEVKLREDEMRAPFYLHKGASSEYGGEVFVSEIKKGRTRHADDGDVPSQVPPVAPLSEEEKAWAAMSRSSSSSSSSGSSFLEQSLNWYWIDVAGRDPSRRKYNSALRFLTKRFNICESFLIDREHILMLPQIIESPNHPGQYLLNLRVANNKISITDDSVTELTNRWITIVDLRQHFVMTLHRVDTHSMAKLRTQWQRIMEANEVSFQEFLLKIIDDALHTYELSLDVHADLLDRCESKVFANECKVLSNDAEAHKRPAAAGARSVQHSYDTETLVDRRILHHFAGSSRSSFLRRLLDTHDHSPMRKMEMNSFLHHLHRRTNVQHRMLNAMQMVLQRAFTKLQLCSDEMAEQMCGSCNELSGRALEVRDDAKTLLDLHISLQSFRTNELMAVLTRVSLFFTPCTFMAGVYGMNFNFMPELEWKWAYPAFWVFCAVLVLCMQRWFLQFG